MRGQPSDTVTATRPENTIDHPTGVQPGRLWHEPFGALALRCLCPSRGESYPKQPAGIHLSLSAQLE